MMARLGKIQPKSNFKNTPRKHAQSMLANTLRDGGYVNCGHRLAIKPTPAN
jgi:hypothetical protein